MFSQRTRDLHKAILAGNYDKVIQCLDVGPKRERKKVLDQVEGGGATPLTEAASRGHNRIVIALLDRGAAIDQESYYAGSALISACRANECDTAELLIARGADIEYRIRNRYQNGYTPLIMACQEGHLDAARLLLEHGANINEGGGGGTVPSRRCRSPATPEKSRPCSSFWTTKHTPMIGLCGTRAIMVASPWFDVFSCAGSLSQIGRVG